MLEYSEKLTLTPYAMAKGDVEGLHDAGMDDEEILEAVIVCCTFNYVCRLADGLGRITRDSRSNSVLGQELTSRGVVVDPKSRGVQ